MAFILATNRKKRKLTLTITQKMTPQSSGSQTFCCCGPLLLLQELLRSPSFSDKTLYISRLPNCGIPSCVRTHCGKELFSDEADKVTQPCCKGGWGSSLVSAESETSYHEGHCQSVCQKRSGSSIYVLRSMLDACNVFMNLWSTWIPYYCNKLAFVNVLPHLQGKKSFLRKKGAGIDFV